MKYKSQIKPSPLHSLSRAKSAFSLLEIVILVALLGLIGLVAITMVGKQPAVIRDVKLESDVTTLNHVIAVYVADGGSLAGLTDPQRVLEKLKMTRPQTEWQSHTRSGSGRFIDTRLRARMTTSVSTDGRQRAKWNTKTQRFELSAAGGSAVSEFYLDEALANTNYGSESRSTAPVVKYNVSTSSKNQGWVWGNAATSNFTYKNPGSNAGVGALNPFNPDEASSTPPTDPGSGGGGSGGSGPGGGNEGGGGGQAPTRLPRPSISPNGGTFAHTAFPGTAAISPNGAPSEGSRLEYRVNNGGWTTYTGSPISLASTDKIEARNVSTDAAVYINSPTASATYYRLVAGFTGSNTGTWGNATGGPNLLTSYENGTESSTFKHGNTKLDLGNGEYLDAGKENVLTFTPSPFEDITPNTWFGLGELSILNGTTFYNSEADGVTISVNLNLTEPAKNDVVHINLGLISTDNSSDRQSSADIVELRNPSTDFTVTIDGVTYRLELSWFSLDPSSGNSQGNQFYVYEGASATAELRARFVSNR